MRRTSARDIHPPATVLAPGGRTSPTDGGNRMKSRGFVTAAAVLALVLSAIAAPALATTRDSGGGAKQCTRTDQRTDTTRFRTRSCVDTRADRVSADIRLEVRSQLPTPAAADDAAVRIRERVRDEERTGDMRVRVRTEHRRRVEGSE